MQCESGNSLKDKFPLFVFIPPPFLATFPHGLRLLQKIPGHEETHYNFFLIVLTDQVSGQTLNQTIRGSNWEYYQT